MARYLIVVLAVALCLTAAPQRARPDEDGDPEPSGGPASKGLRALEGKWTVTRAVFGGREMKAPPGLTYEFAGGKLTRTMPLGKKGGDNKQLLDVKVDLSKKPHRITLTPQNGGVIQS